MKLEPRNHTQQPLSELKVPMTLGIIMDGNRRWAAERGLPKLEGHRAGLNKIKEVLVWCREAGVKNVVVYALSTENLKRTAEEVAYYQKLIRVAVRGFLAEFKREGGVLHVVGDLSLLPKDTEKIVRRAEEETKGSVGEFNFYIALAYGGRNELVHAVKSIAAKGLKPEEITEDVVANNLMTAGMPDPDLIIRTSGEQRLSGFLPWQSVYSELYFSKTYWPAFAKEEFTSILKEYAGRSRRMGR